MTKIRFSMLYILTLFVGCSENDYNAASDISLPMEFGTEYPMVTRASDNGFADGDCMGIFVTDYEDGKPKAFADEELRADNVAFTFDEASGKWTGAKSIFWKNSATAVDVIGYYPYVDDFDDATAYTFTVNTRQDKSSQGGELGGYEASDLLWAKAEKQMPDGGKIVLSYKHIMAGINISLEMGDGFTAAEWAAAAKHVYISNAAISCTVNLETGKVEAQENGSESVTPTEYNGSYRAIVVPQTYIAGTPIVRIMMDGQDYKLTKNEAVTLNSGKMHKFTIKVDKSSESGRYTFSLANESVSQWLDDEDFHDGIVREYITVNVATPGTFAETLVKMGLDYTSLTGLKVTGTVNDDDIMFMGDMPVLTSLNMKDLRIINNEEKDRIPDYAFYKSLLSHIVLPDTLKEIGWLAFLGTYLKGTIIFPEGLESIGGWAFAQTYDVGASSFYAVFPSSLKNIDEGAFSGDNGVSSGLKGELNLPDGLESIGEGAFSKCCNITGSLILPSKIKSIGESAFYACSFTGDLIIPDGIKEIPDISFDGCDFDGNLILQEGVTDIGSRAFHGCKFRGELSLPSTLRKIGFASFQGNSFTSVTLPDNLQLLGAQAFKDCQYLAGSISFPSSIVVVPKQCFMNCPLISEVTLHKGIKKVDEEAFANDTHITSIVSENQEPPTLASTAFEGLAKTQPVVEVSTKGIDEYKRDRQWSEFARLTEYRNFYCRPAMACALNTEHQQTLTINADGAWKLAHKPSWVSVSPDHGTSKTAVTLTFNEMSSGASNRADSIVFELEGTDAKTYCKLSQYDYQYAEDQVVTLQKHTKGNGISIYFIGDGWDGEAIASGEYMNLCKQDMEYFFGLPPYDRLRDYFDVYAMVALSQQTGLNTTSTYRDTKFGTIYSAGYESCCSGYPAKLIPDDEAIFPYISQLTGRKQGERYQNGDMWKSLIVLIPNSTDYTGCTYYYDDGSTISICPPSDRDYPNDTRGIIQHEAGGHGMGKLADESITKNKYVSDKVIEEIQGYKSLGWYANISTTGLAKNVTWADLIYDTRYSNYVDVYEGAYGYTRGVYRSESNSCMNYAIPYYNAISRLEITRRVFDLAGVSFDIDRDFYDVDSWEWGSTGVTRANTKAELRPIVSHKMPMMVKRGQFKKHFKKR